MGNMSYWETVKAIDPAHLVAYWRLNERSGVAANDSSGHGFSGVMSNVSLGIAGIGDENAATHFDPTANSVINVNSLPFRQAFNGTAGTIMLWVKLNLAGWTTDQAFYGVIFWVDGNNFVSIYKQASVGQRNRITFHLMSGGVSVASTPVVVTADGWVCFHFKWDKAANHAQGYQNGLPSGSTLSGFGTWVGQPTVNIIGAVNASPSSEWWGEIAHVALWNVALTDDQIKQLAVIPPIPLRTHRTRYQVALFDNRGVLYAIHDLTGVEQMRYSKRVGDFGRFLITLPMRYADVRMMQKDSLAWVFRTDPKTNKLAEDGIYFLRYHDTEPGEVGDALILEGNSAEHLLARRAYDPEDDPLVANGYSTKGGPCASVMREIVVEQCIEPAFHTERAFPGLSAREIVGDSTPNAAFRKEMADVYVIETLQELRDAHGVDFWIEFKGMDTTHGYPKFEFVTGRMGEDKSKKSHPNGPYVYLTPSAGHLYSPKLTVDAREETNMVYVLGPGANGNRLVYRQGSTAVTDSPFNRIESIVDGSQAEELDEFLTAANDALEKGRSRVTFDFEPSTYAEGALYELDWDLGDIVTVGHRGIEMTMRIIEVEITVTAEGEVIKVTAELLDEIELQTFMETNRPDQWEDVGIDIGGGTRGRWAGLMSLPHFEELWKYLTTKAHGSWEKRIRQAARRFSLSRSELTGALRLAGILPSAGQPGRMMTLEVESEEEPDEGYLMIDTGMAWRTPGIVHTRQQVINDTLKTVDNADWDKEDESFKVRYTPRTPRVVVRANFTAQRHTTSPVNGYLDLAYYDETTSTWIRAGSSDYGLAQTTPGVSQQYHLHGLFTDLTPGKTYTFYLIGKSAASYGNQYPAGYLEFWVKGD